MLIFFYLLFSVLIGIWADKKPALGFLGGFILSLLLSPLIGLIITAASKDKPTTPQAADYAKLFTLNKKQLNGKVSLITIKSYAGSQSIANPTDFDLALLTKQLFNTTFTNAEVVDTLPPDSNGYIHFVYKRK